MLRLRCEVGGHISNLAKSLLPRGCCGVSVQRGDRFRGWTATGQRRFRAFFFDRSPQEWQTVPARAAERERVGQIVRVGAIGRGLAASGAPSRRAATRPGSWSRSSSLQSRTSATSTSVRTCVLCRSRVSVWSRICAIASSVSRPSCSPSAFTSREFARPTCAASDPASSRRAPPSRRGSSRAIAR